MVASFLVFLILGAWGTAQVKDGLDLTDLVPRETAEFQFLEAQSKYFGFYSINAVTKVTKSCQLILSFIKKKAIYSGEEPILHKIMVIKNVYINTNVL